jgi:hypothetical protein
MSEKLSEFEKKLKAYLMAHPDIAEAMRTGNQIEHNMSDEWKQEVEKNSTPEKRLIARKKAKVAIQLFEKKKRRQRITIRTLTASCACLFIFFAFTPPGQVAAKEIIETVTTFFAGGIRIETKGIESSQREIAELERREFHSVEKAAEYSGKDMIYIDSPDLRIESISVEASNVMNSISTTYSLPDKRQIIVFHDTYNENQSASFDLYKGDGYTERKLFNGKTMYCMNYDDGTYGGSAVWENITLTIVSENVSWDEMGEYIDHFAIVGQ